MLRNNNLVIHELGDMFDNLFSYRAGGRWSGPLLALTMDLADNRNGFGDRFVYQQSDVISRREIFADMYVHWIQGGWALNDNGNLTDDAGLRVDWLNQNMPGYVP